MSTQYKALLCESLDDFINEEKRNRPRIKSTHVDSRGNHIDASIKKDGFRSDIFDANDEISRRQPIKREEPTTKYINDRTYNAPLNRVSPETHPRRERPILRKKTQRPTFGDIMPKNIEINHNIEDKRPKRDNSNYNEVDGNIADTNDAFMSVAELSKMGSKGDLYSYYDEDDNFGNMDYGQDEIDGNKSYNYIDDDPNFDDNFGNEDFGDNFGNEDFDDNFGNEDFGDEYDDNTYSEEINYNKW